MSFCAGSLICGMVLGVNQLAEEERDMVALLTFLIEIRILPSIQFSSEVFE